MNRKAGTILGAVLVGALTLFAAGCGGGGKAASNTTPTTTASSTTTTTSSASTTTTSTTSTTSNSLNGVASLANCRDLRNLGSQLTAAFSGAKNNLPKQAQLLQEFAAKTPSDIRPDFEVLANAFTKIATDLKGIDLSSGKTPTAAQLAQLQKLSTEIDQTKLRQASAHIAAWAAKNCKAS